MMKRLNCDQVDWVLRSSPLEQISEEQLRAIEEHLSDCALCRESWQAEIERRLKSSVPREKVTPHGPEATNPARGQSPKRYLVGAAALLLFLIPVFYVFGVARDAARRADSQAAMKSFWLICKKYASESKNENWPALASMDNLWVPELEPLHGAFFTNTQIMVSVYHPDNRRLKREITEAWNQPLPDFDKAACIFGESFAYLGYCVQDETDFERLRNTKENDAIPSGNALLLDSVEGEPVYRLLEGIERFLLTDIGNPANSTLHSSIPVLIEIATWKYKDSEADFEGANVLYFDGHVAFVPLGTFPVLPSILDTLSGS